ncbi:MAG TPA: helix-turn-helix domain-containing protein [Candidatus Saccharimonadales bacterium]|nr:helix-turn-helix domain-containing protein [Candidatus Saccharimonadales bacterium]
MDPRLFPEAKYPITFRSAEAKALGDQLKLRHSVELVGMKHVGIFNFAQFFLSQPDIVKTYVSTKDEHIFIPVDLNDLVEKNIFAFWSLTFKRLVDIVSISVTLTKEDRDRISSMFLSSIQSRNIFLTLDNMRESLKIIIKNNIFPTIFFLRFDRMRDALNEEFLANLEGLRDATGQEIAYVFTSFRSLDSLAPGTFNRRSLNTFSNVSYFKPAGDFDMKVIFESLNMKYHANPDKKVFAKLLELCGGHVQYLQIALIILSEKKVKISEDNLLSILVEDERMELISVEMWESLTDNERSTLKRILDGSVVVDFSASYLSQVGMIIGDGEGKRIFSSIFEHFAKSLSKSTNGVSVDFTKKENLLYKLLVASVGDICEREKIIETVWPEYEEMGVSDWTIDQLIARLRVKLKAQKSKYVIKTVRTRGYRLVEER